MEKSQLGWPNFVGYTRPQLPFGSPLPRAPVQSQDTNYNRAALRLSFTCCQWPQELSWQSGTTHLQGHLPWHTPCACGCALWGESMTRLHQLCTIWGIPLTQWESSGGQLSWHYGGFALSEWGWEYGPQCDWSRGRESNSPPSSHWSHGLNTRSQVSVSENQESSK